MMISSKIVRLNKQGLVISRHRLVAKIGKSKKENGISSILRNMTASLSQISNWRLSQTVWTMYESVIQVEISSTFTRSISTGVNVLIRM